MYDTQAQAAAEVHALSRKAVSHFRLSPLLLLLLWSVSGAASLTSYTVRAGDTLFSLAQRSGTSVERLLQLNGSIRPVLKVGQVLRLPGSLFSPAAVLVRPVSSPVRGPLPQPRVSPPSLRLPRPDLSKISGPVTWPTAPAATVASFIGWLPLTSSSPIGDALPVRTYLHGLAFDRQTYNNCGPSALSAVLGFYRVQISQEAIQRTARPNGGYMQISAIAPELARFKLKTAVIRQGQLAQVKRLLALGIPVIVLQWYDRPGNINHFRVVRGYDDQAGIFWISDSMVGPLTYLSYRSFDVLWNTQSRQLFPVYPEGYDRLVQGLMAKGS
ncbi:LysM peptidoglycan-binding domain-containing protein [Deinococcus sp. QL22]|uniref:LysM peptidoglycan-binding domain-containing protein n=1 Tax=Deinococcus sp. QL22 TaxID=2939437 RepID=UPI00201730E8|nr:LysM peptidoglycan-binding domain-containing protein [Deinococcus sp. QL22]UQN09406.1 LysM peptidoglycan-binding domain-containing protein [Deinococcus sp. QL22]